MDKICGGGSSEEICQQLAARGDERMVYRHVPEIVANQKHKEMKELPLKGCTKNQLFVYQPNKDPVMR